LLAAQQGSADREGGLFGEIPGQDQIDRRAPEPSPLRPDAQALAASLAM
jgi:hypothetical protein